MEQEYAELKRKVADLERFNLNHSHSGVSDQRIDILDLVGLIPVVSTAPTHTPKDFQEQFRIYRNATTYRFYWHDGTGWRYATGT